MPSLPFTQEATRDLPDAPGVYVFLGEKGDILYVGKATSLKDRVRSYFSNARDGRLVTAVIHRFARGIDFILTDDEKKALLLENSMIKKHAPRFNIRLRDDKTYFSLRLDLGARWPWFQIVRKRRREEGVLYFGPYTSAFSCRKTLQFLGSIFPLRTCPDSVLENRVRPCLSHEIKQCVAPCVGLVGEAEYRAIVLQAVEFLKGRNDEVVADLEKKMKEAAAATEYERAAELRDRLTAIRKTVENTVIVREGGRSFDVIGLSRDGRRVHVSVLEVRDAVMGRAAVYKCAALEDDDAVLAAFLGQYYGDTRPVPAEVCLPDECKDMALLGDILSERRGGTVSLVVPQRGEKKRLLALAARNAQAAAEGDLAADQEKAEILDALRDRLSLARLPRSIECFDISNFQGAFVVGSCVAFRDGKPDKSRYRRYRVRDVVGQDDFASMEEVVRRRLKRGVDEGDLPDLIVIDGGPSQLARAVQALKDSGAPAIDIVSLAKARSGERAPGAIQEKERIFRPDLPVPIVLDQSSPEMLLLMRLRDEAHRFAITYHRRLRAKSQTASLLELVPGIGKSRAQSLLRTLGSLAAVRDASDEALLSVKGMNTERLAALRSFFAGGGTLPIESKLEDL